MPTLSCTEVDIGKAVGGCVAVVGTKHGGDVYIIAYSAVSGLFIINATKKEVTLISDLADPNTIGGISRLVNYSIKGSKVYMRTLHIRSGTLVVSDIDVDLSALSASRSEALTHSISWIDSWTEICGGVLPPYLFVTADADTEYIYCIDIDDGSTRQIATGFGQYTPGPSYKVIHYKDDVYMLLGRHYSGDTFKLLKLYSGSVTDLGFSTGGGSPRALIGGMGVFRDELLIPATSSGVVNQDNDIAILDHRFNRKVTLDVGSVTGWTTNDLIPGFFIVGKGTDRYYALLPVDRQPNGYNDTFRVYWIEFDLVNGILSSQLLYEVAVPDEVRALLFCEYCDAFGAPVIDPITKKLYFHYSVSTTTRMGICEVDLSDVWNNIIELNKHAWIIGQARIPTQLTLEVTPL